jgi:ribonuclease P protein component
VRTGQIEVRFLASPLRPLPGGGPRVGIIVPRYGRSAVARNTVKRRLRELARLELLPALLLRAPLDVVVRAAPSAYAASYQLLRVALQKAVTQLPVPLPVQPSSQEEEKSAP